MHAVIYQCIMLLQRAANTQVPVHLLLAAEMLDMQGESGVGSSVQSGDQKDSLVFT